MDGRKEGRQAGRNGEVKGYEVGLESNNKGNGKALMLVRHSIGRGTVVIDWTFTTRV